MNNLTSADLDAVAHANPFIFAIGIAGLLTSLFTVALFFAACLAIKAGERRDQSIQ